MKSQLKLGGILTICFLLLGSATGWCLAHTKKAEVPEVTLSSSARNSNGITLNLGEIYAGQTVRKVFAIRNAGESTIHLKPKTACGCLRLDVEQRFLYSGGTCRVEAVFESFKRPNDLGRVTTSFEIVGSSADREPESMTVNGEVVAFVKPAVEVEGALINIWRFHQNDTIQQPKTIKMKNVTGDDLTLESLDLSSQDGAFSLKTEGGRIKTGGEFTMVANLAHAPLDDAPHVWKTPVFLKLAGREQSDAIRLDFSFIATPVADILARPSVVLFGPEEIAHGTAKELSLELEPDVTIDSIAVTSKRVQVKQIGAGLVEVNVSEEQGFERTQEHIEVQYSAGARKGKLLIPVLLILNDPS
ncbi:MAG: DUF1573 domain-containing protein [Candidatus Hydrogenedentales bacterium]|jgi:hypothetical protein